jgi:hypothetical protein
MAHTTTSSSSVLADDEREVYEMEIARLRQQLAETAALMGVALARANGTLHELLAEPEPLWEPPED